MRPAVAGLWGHSRRPRRGDFPVGPGKFCGDAVEVDGFAGVQIAEDADEFLEILESGGLLAEDAAGAIAAADAQFHTTVRGKIQRGEKAGGNSDVADGRICDEVPSRIFLVLAAMRVRSGNGSFQMTWESKIQPKEKPEDSGVMSEAEDPIDRNVGFDGNASSMGAP